MKRKNEPNFDYHLDQVLNEEPEIAPVVIKTTSGNLPTDQRAIVLKNRAIAQVVGSKFNITTPKALYKELCRNFPNLFSYRKDKVHSLHTNIGTYDTSYLLIEGSAPLIEGYLVAAELGHTYTSRFAPCITLCLYKNDIFINTSILLYHKGTFESQDSLIKRLNTGALKGFVSHSLTPAEVIKAYLSLLPRRFYPDFPPAESNDRFPVLEILKLVAVALEGIKNYAAVSSEKRTFWNYLYNKFLINTYQQRKV
jgi:hypothetical protein